jgi:glycosyltransferase involved in cell wall biosynthesis
MELVKDFGMHFRNKDIDDLTDKLEVLVRKGDLVTQGSVARKFVEEKYNWDNIALQIKELYCTG